MSDSVFLPISSIIVVFIIGLVLGYGLAESGSSSRISNSALDDVCAALAGENYTFYRDSSFATHYTFVCVPSSCRRPIHCPGEIVFVVFEE